MQATKLAGLKPESVFGYFEQLCAIPHGSGNTKAISDHLVAFAKEKGLRYIQDEANNVILFGDATPGYEDHSPVILQGHMDMVCEKDADCPIAMDKEGLDVTHDGDYVFARGTTLGGDNGIAVAYAMAILADPTIPHPGGDHHRRRGDRYAGCGCDRPFRAAGSHPFESGLRGGGNLHRGLRRRRNGYLDLAHS